MTLTLNDTERNDLIQALYEKAEGDEKCVVELRELSKDSQREMYLRLALTFEEQAKRGKALEKKIEGAEG